jgi:hypothetical protein
LHPFDVMRILGASTGTPDTLCFDEQQVGAIIAAGGLETWWGPGSAIPQDPSPTAAMARALCHELVSRGFVGRRKTRLDNCFRGLDVNTQSVLERGVEVLVRVGLLEISAAPTGRRVAVVESAVERLAGFASGKQRPLELSALWA